MSTINSLFENDGNFFSLNRILPNTIDIIYLLMYLIDAVHLYSTLPVSVTILMSTNVCLSVCQPGRVCCHRWPMYVFQCPAKNRNLYKEETWEPGKSRHLSLAGELNLPGN